MIENLTQKIRNDFARLARYDAGGWNHNNHYHHFLIGQLPQHCHTVLDLGCGTGEFSLLLASHVERVIAVDLSPITIKIARERTKNQTNIDFLVADISHWKMDIYSVLKKVQRLFFLSDDFLCHFVKSNKVFFYWLHRRQLVLDLQNKFLLF